MSKERIITLKELSGFGPVSNLNQQAIALVKQQKETWGLARENYTALSNAQTKKFDFGDLTIVAQHNPARIRSSAAKTDAQSIAQRPCFLCLDNLSHEQKGLSFQGDYLILTNPFPVFPLHLTISTKGHVPQRIKDFFPDMLSISRELHDFTVFYNGPQSGASAPDHFHFQAGNKSFMPVEKALKVPGNAGDLILQNDHVSVFAVENRLHRLINMLSNNPKVLADLFPLVIDKLPGAGNSEPPLNILCNYEAGRWRVIIFPRGKRRPSHYFRSGEAQVVVGPAAVELGGLLVLPRVKDFKKINKTTISEIYSEVAIGEADFRKWKKEMTLLRKTL